MQIARFFSSGFALYIHENAFLVPFPGQLYGHSLHFPLQGFCGTSLHEDSICESHICFGGPVYEWDIPLNFRENGEVFVCLFVYLFTLLFLCDM